MKLCVAIPTRNRAQLAIRAAASVIPQLGPADELIIADDGSSDRTSEVVRAWLSDHCSRGRVLSLSYSGVSATRNAALRFATAPVVCFIDDDETAHPQWLSALRRAWDELGPTVGVIGGPLRPDWKAERPAWLADYLLYVLSVLDLGSVRLRLDDPDHQLVWGGNMSVRVEAALGVGGFDPDRGQRPGMPFERGEEEEFQRRLVSAGWEVWYEPAAAIDHLVPPERLSTAFFIKHHRERGLSDLARGRNRFAALPLVLRSIARYVVLGLLRRPEAVTSRFTFAYGWALLTGRRSAIGPQRLGMRRVLSAGGAAKKAARRPLSLLFVWRMRLTRLRLARGRARWLRVAWFRLTRGRDPRQTTLKRHGVSIVIPAAFFPHYIGSSYEPLTTRVFLRVVSPGMVVADVGAHIGYYTLLAARAVGPHGAVHAVEPCRETLQVLEENVRLNGFENVKIHRLAASASSGRRAFHLTTSSDSHGLYLHPLAPSVETIEVSAARLDELVDGPLHVAKIDVEGAEHEALIGMTGLFESDMPPSLFVEWNPACLREAGRDPLSLPPYLVELGYSELVVLDDWQGRVRSVRDVLCEIAAGDLPAWRYVTLWGQRSPAATIPS